MQVGEKTLQQKRYKLSSQLQAHSISVVTVGQDIQLSIPSRLLFHANSANLNESNSFVLSQLLQFINTYHFISVSVDSYYQQIHNQKIRQEVSSRQAEVVAAYLREKSLDARFIYSQGHFKSSLLSSTRIKHAQHINDRVVISWRSVPSDFERKCEVIS